MVSIITVALLLRNICRYKISHKQRAYMCANQMLQTIIYSCFRTLFLEASSCSQCSFLICWWGVLCIRVGKCSSDAWVCQNHPPLQTSSIKSYVNFMLLFLQVVPQCWLKILNIQAKSGSHLYKQPWHLECFQMNDVQPLYQ